MTKKFLIFFAAALFVTTVPAFADTITQPKNFNGIPNMSGSLNFNQFDTHGGTWILNSIEVSFTLWNNGGQFIIDNDGDLPASGTFQFGAKGTISSSDVKLLTNTLDPVPGQLNAYHSQGFSLTANVGDEPNDYDPTPPDGLLYIGGTENDSNSGFIGNTVWTLGNKGFLGTGTYNINYSIERVSDCGGIGGIEFAVTPGTANGDVTVIYTYDIIPEPATITLLCMGAFSLLKRKSSK